MTDDVLRTKPVLLERHRVFFSSLSPTQVHRVVLRMQQDHVIGRVRPPPEPSGGWLFELCREAGLDHASVLFPLCRDSDSVGRDAIEKLLGHPIQVWRPQPRPYPVHRQQTPGSSTAPPRPGPGVVTGDMVVLEVVTQNPKKPGTATYTRFKYWEVGKTVSECMKRGLSRADVLWDSDPGRRFVVLGTREDWEKKSKST